MISSRRFRNRAEGLLQFLIHQRTDAVVLRLGKVIQGELKAETTAAFLNYPRTNVGGHDQQRGKSLCDPWHRSDDHPQDLQQHIEHVGVGFFDFVKQHHCIGLRRTASVS